VHFATHGRLDGQSPERSHILLAGDYRLTVVDVQLLPLEGVDLAVLSACETGVGAQGLEFATLARAFAHAQVPTTVATLWRVNDEASARLMESFYAAWGEKQDVFAALADAQRAMLKGEEAYRHPGAWAAYLAFGKP
jgi:CHAT domain-containing protein